MVFHRKGEYKMSNISQEYLLLFNTITEVEEMLRTMREKLISVQQQAEELYIAGAQD